ncbi:DUF938 domain-containing protein [Bradyrhizobium sp. CB3481]|uniref:DUF938 domain-containing protein n=1 Tax=Bradyrhizobium sp. CB3481 TaxID=3039158 RepID=UPI0032C23FD4
MSDRPNIDPYPLSPYVAWAGNRNKDAILKTFEELFPTKGAALEVATGAGLHINYFAPCFPERSVSAFRLRSKRFRDHQKEPHRRR